MSVLDDHDHVYGEKLRFAVGAANDHEATAATAVQLLTLGIPCLYYGTEQGFAGPEEAERRWRCLGPAFRGHPLGPEFQA